MKFAIFIYSYSGSTLSTEASEIEVSSSASDTYEHFSSSASDTSEDVSEQTIYLYSNCAYRKLTICSKDRNIKSDYLTRQQIVMSDSQLYMYMYVLLVLNSLVRTVDFQALYVNAQISSRLFKISSHGLLNCLVSETSFGRTSGCSITVLLLPIDFTDQQRRYPLYLST